MWQLGFNIWTWKNILQLEVLHFFAICSRVFKRQNLSENEFSLILKRGKSFDNIDEKKLSKREIKNEINFEYLLKYEI